MDVKKIICLLFFILYSILSGSHALAKLTVKQLSTVSTVPELIKNQGYLLVYINVEGTAPSIEFSKLKTNRTDFWVTKSFSYSNNYRLDLKQVTPGLYFIPMLAGIYQITRINAPFYDLPYWLSTEKQAIWRFAVEKNKINFIGEIYIAKERGTNEVDVNLFNRFATYQKQIISEVEKLPTRFPLALKPGYQDEFLHEFEK